jgi:hypothetical protein
VTGSHGISEGLPRSSATGKSLVLSHRRLTPEAPEAMSLALAPGEC